MIVWIIAAVAVLFIVLVFVTGYVKASPDTAYIISGLRKTPKVLIGKAGVKIPFFEKKDELSLQLIPIDVKTSNAVPTAVPMGPAEGRGLAAHPQKSFPGSGKSPRLSAIIAVADRRTLPKESVFLTIGGTKHERSAV